MFNRQSAHAVTDDPCRSGRCVPDSVAKNSATGQTSRIAFLFGVVSPAALQTIFMSRLRNYSVPEMRLRALAHRICRAALSFSRSWATDLRVAGVVGQAISPHYPFAARRAAHHHRDVGTIARQDYLFIFDRFSSEAQGHDGSVACSVASILVERLKPPCNCLFIKRAIYKGTGCSSHDDQC